MSRSAMIHLHWLGEAPPDTAAPALTVPLEIRVYGQTLRGSLTASGEEIRLGDLVAPARRIAAAVCDATLRQTADHGAHVPCRRGCSACCRYLVPLSPPEAARMYEDLAALPPPLRTGALERFCAHGRTVLDALADAPGHRPPEPVGRWYAGLDLDCPLLDPRGSCLLYPARPLACREHFAASDPAHCAGYAAGVGRTVEPPFSMVNALSLLAGELEQTEPESVLLPLAPAWADAHAPRLARTWTPPEVLPRFARTVHLLATCAQQAIEAA